MAAVPQVPAQGTGTDTGTRTDTDPPAWMTAGPWVVAALAAVLYGWGIAHADLHPYYSAAVRSMSGGWRDFLFGAFDPAGSITIDKVPGAFWPQALSVRVFGLHPWAVALPQVIEGVLTVVLLYHVVARWLGGPPGRVAGLLAAFILALTPITVALNRHNLPDTMLTLMLVAAAAAWQRAVRTGQLAALVLCGLCVGVAFQAKMLQAWLVVPIFAVTYVYATPGSRLRRWTHVAVLGLSTVVVSSAWLALAAATPATGRPYVDGTTNNNPLSLVFGYNALGRYGSSADDGVGGVTSASSGAAHWDLLVDPTYAAQISWLIPAALIALVAALVWLWSRRRGSRLWAGFAMWGLWLIAYALAFSASNRVHAYYTAALGPAVAALCAAGLVMFYPAYRDRARYSWVLPSMIGATVAWAVWVGGHFPRFVPGMELLLAVAGVAVVAAMVACLRSMRPDPRLVAGAAAAGLAVMLLSPAVWALSALDSRYSGPAATPAAGWVGHSFRLRTIRSSATHRLPAVVFDHPTGFTRSLLAYLRTRHGNERYLVATEHDRLAEPLLRAAPVEVLPLGGFSGRTPFPTTAQLSTLVGTGQLRFVLLSAATAAAAHPDSATATWVTEHCVRVARTEYGARGNDSVLYDCRPAGPPG